MGDIIVMEKKLELEGVAAVAYAKNLKVTTSEEYGVASQLLVENKRMAKSVKEYWSEPKTQAKSAHQAVVNKEKAMLEPLLEAERIIKTSMLSYQRAVDEAKRRAEAEARERQRAEAERLMQQAIAEEKAGNEAEAAISMAMAEMTEDLKPIPAWIDSPKASGISTRKSWKARIVNNAVVPIIANGVEIRPIDMSALDNLARVSKGTITIPGVEFYEHETISARS